MGQAARDQQLDQERREAIFTEGVGRDFEDWFGTTRNIAKETNHMTANIFGSGGCCQKASVK